MRTESVHATARLREGTDLDQAVKSINRTDGVICAEPMFPGETDEELASLLALVLEPAKARRALASVKRRAYVQSATRSADRALIR